MTKPSKKKKELSKLFYNFYCEVLDLYTKNMPQTITGTTNTFKKTKTKSEIFGHSKVRLLRNSYYWKHKKNIQNLSSFKEIITHIKKSPDILSGCTKISSSKDKSKIGQPTYKATSIETEYGSIIFMIAEEIFETYSKSRVKHILNLTPEKETKLSINEDAIKHKLTNSGKGIPLTPKSHIYYLQNLKIEKNFTITIKDNQLQFKKLSDKDRDLLLNCNHFGTEHISTDITSIETAITTKTFLKDSETKGLLTLLRLFKHGEFRLYATGRLTEEITKKHAVAVNTFANVVEKPLNEKSIVLIKKYELTNKEIKSFAMLTKNNFINIQNSNFAFASESLNLLHSLEDKYRLPIIFYILESFFEKMIAENRYRLSYYITKLLNESYDFTKTIRNLYDLRSDIVHGNEQKKVDTTIRKIKKQDKTSCKNMQDCVMFAEDIMRKVWQSILKDEFFKKDIEKELF